MIHVSNLYYTQPMAEAAHKLVNACGLKKVFFTNSGTEAIEGAIKLARKYAWTRDNGSTDHEIIATAEVSVPFLSQAIRIIRKPSNH